MKADIAKWLMGKKLFDPVDRQQNFWEILNVCIPHGKFVLINYSQRHGIFTKVYRVPFFGNLNWLNSFKIFEREKQSVCVCVCILDYKNDSVPNISIT